MKKETFYPTEGVAVEDPYKNWLDHAVGDSLYYSFRDTCYPRENFPSAMHYHEYYEMVIFEQGEIDQLCESEVYALHRGDVVIEPPGQMHHSAVRSASTRYVRHVFYFYPEAFAEFPALLDFLNRGPILNIGEPEPLFALLRQFNRALQQRDAAAPALVRGLLLQCFYLLNQATPQQSVTAFYLPSAKIKQYVDSDYASIRTVQEIADRFFYSREYLSRLFRAHYNVTVADYLRSRRILAARPLIAQGLSPAEVCFQVGFGSLSAFNHAFKEETGMTPGEYRKKNR